MPRTKSPKLAAIARWEFADIAYRVYATRGTPTRQRVVVLALGTARRYRSVVLTRGDARRAASSIADAPDVAARTTRAEALLDAGDSMTT